MLLLAGVVFSSAGKGVSCSALLSVGYFKDSANILIVGAGFVKSVGAISRNQLLLVSIIVKYRSLITQISWKDQRG